MFDEAVKEMQRPLVGKFNQGILAIEDLDLGIIQVKRGEVRVVEPQLRPAGMDVGEEPARVRRVQIADGGAQGHGIAGRLMVHQDELLDALHVK